MTRDLERCREAHPDLFVTADSVACHELPGSYPADGDGHAWAQCWQQIDEQPGCFVYRDHYHTGDSIRMSGEWECLRGVIVRVTATIEASQGDVSEGPT